MAYLNQLETVDHFAYGNDGNKEKKSICFSAFLINY